MKYKANIYLFMSTDKDMESAYGYMGYFETNLTQNELEKAFEDIATKRYKARAQGLQFASFFIIVEALEKGLIRNIKVDKKDNMLYYRINPNYISDSVFLQSCFE